VGWVGLQQKGANSQAGVYPEVGERSRVRVLALVLKKAEEDGSRLSLMRSRRRWRRGVGSSLGSPSAGDSTPLPVPPSGRLARVSGPRTVAWAARLCPCRLMTVATEGRSHAILGEVETCPRAEVYTGRPRGVGGLGWRITNPALPRIRTSFCSPRPSRQVPGPGLFLPRDPTPGSESKNGLRIGVQATGCRP